MNQLANWFWAMVTRNEQTNCWEWNGSRDQGYGYFTVKGRRRLAHRFSIAYVTGEDSPLLACHRCDNPPCVNPFHLFRGTASDNFKDMHRKGRGNQIVGWRAMMKVRPIPRCGEDHKQSKLTEKQVRWILDHPPRFGHLASMARKLGVTHQTVRNIIRGQKWKHIKREVIP